MKSKKKLIDLIKSIYSKENIIPLHRPIFEDSDFENIDNVIKSTFISSVGKEISEFENKISSYLGIDHAVAMNSGTSALHMALLSVGVKPNTEVITQSLTFVATLNAISYTGAQTILLDVDRDSMGLSPIALKEFLIQNTKIKNDQCIRKDNGKQISACVPMHTFGMPCRIEEIASLCKEFKIPLIEDSTEALGSKYGDQYIGTFGDVGTFSFNGNKIITTGAGGMCVTANEHIKEFLVHNSKTAKIDHPYEYIHDNIGYNYRLPNLNAAIGISQLNRINLILKAKKSVAMQYQNLLRDDPNIDIQRNYEEKVQSNYWFNTIIFESQQERNEFAVQCSENGIMTRYIWRPMHLLGIHKFHVPYELTVTEDLYNRSLNIPSSMPIN